MEDAETLVLGVKQLAQEKWRKQDQQQNQQAESRAQTQQTHLASQQQRQQQQQQQQQQHQQPLTPREAFFAPTECLPLTAAAGRRCAELLCPYPPGVPLLLPGETITAAAIDALRATLTSGGVVVGARDPELSTVLVVANTATG